MSYDAEKHSTMAAGEGFFGYPLPLPVLRALWGFIAFIPFCWLWGIKSFTLFAIIGTLYFMPVHWIFDKVIERWTR